MKEKISVTELVLAIVASVGIGWFVRVGYVDGNENKNNISPLIVIDNIPPGMVSRTSSDNRERSNLVQGFTARVTAYCPCT